MKQETDPIVNRGTRITIYDDDPGTIVAIRWNKYAGWTYGIRPDNGHRIFYVWESQVARELIEREKVSSVATSVAGQNSHLTRKP